MAVGPVDGLPVTPCINKAGGGQLTQTPALVFHLPEAEVGGRAGNGEVSQFPFLRSWRGGGRMEAKER